MPPFFVSIVTGDPKGLTMMEVLQVEDVVCTEPQRSHKVTEDNLGSSGTASAVSKYGSLNENGPIGSYI